LANFCSASSNLFNKFSAASSVVFIPGSTAENVFLNFLELGLYFSNAFVRKFNSKFPFCSCAFSCAF